MRVACSYGVRNSLLVAPMPTASTAQILGNCESFEPYTSNIYTRRVLSGEFQVVRACHLGSASNIMAGLPLVCKLRNLSKFGNSDVVAEKAKDRGKVV